MEKVFDENDVNILVAPADSALAHPAATAGRTSQVWRQLKTD
jgi:hypothetical protein